MFTKLQISGWLAKDLGSKFLSYELDTPLKSLHVLNLRYWKVRSFSFYILYHCLSIIDVSWAFYFCVVFGLLCNLYLNGRGNDLNMNDANDLKSALAHMPKLSSLDIGDNPLEDEGIR